MKQLWILFGFCSVLIAGCNIINPTEETPFFIKVKNPQILIDKNQGYYSNLGIKMAWVETGVDSLGYIPIPGTFPSLSSAKANYTLYGAVSELGQGFMAIYPFWKPKTYAVDVTPPDTFVIEPVFEYYADTTLVFPFKETFESSSILLKNNIATSSAVILEYDAADKHEGQRSGKAVFNETFKDFEVVTDDGYFFLPTDKAAYLELTYKSNISFSIGLFYNSFGLTGEIPQSAFVYESPTTWKTVYLRLNNLMQYAPVGVVSADYKLFIRAKGDGTAKQLNIDNVRILYKKN